MKRPLFVIVDKVIREITFPKSPRASTDIMETPATQNLKEVTKKENKVINLVNKVAKVGKIYLRNVTCRGLLFVKFLHKVSC